MTMKYQKNTRYNTCAPAKVIAVPVRFTGCCIIAVAGRDGVPGMTALWTAYVADGGRIVTFLLPVTGLRAFC